MVFAHLRNVFFYFFGLKPRELNSLVVIYKVLVLAYLIFFIRLRASRICLGSFSVKF